MHVCVIFVSLCKLAKIRTKTSFPKLRQGQNVIIPKSERKLYFSELGISDPKMINYQTIWFNNLFLYRLNPF